MGCFYLIQRSVGLLLSNTALSWAAFISYSALLGCLYLIQRSLGLLLLQHSVGLLLSRLNFEAGPARAPLPHHAAKKKEKKNIYSQLKLRMT